MSEVVTIKARRPNGATEECSLEISHVPPWALIFTGAGLKIHESPGEDLFDALISLRLSLERLGIQLLCAGARRDVFPSGMSRSMGGGRKAYVLRLGKRGELSDLLDIFDYAEPELIAGVGEQKEFYKKWLESLKIIR